jgi:hypothetical protein
MRSMDRELSRDSILEAVERELRRRFGGSHAPDAISRAASTSVDEYLSQDVRVKAFIPVLAGRPASARLRAVLPGRT